MIISFGHFKGGTGKTTSCLNIAGYLARFGSRVLAMDLDPQSNLTTGLGIEGEKLEHTIHDVLEKKSTLDRCIISSGINNLDIVPSSTELGKKVKRYRVDSIKRSLPKVMRRYDFILIDTPPSHRQFISTGVISADKNILVLDPGVFSLAGIDKYNDIISSNKGEITLGIINGYRRMWNPFASDPSVEVKKQAETILGAVYEVPFSRHIYESQKRGVPISHHKPYSKAGAAYMRIANKILTDSGN
mgnify:CR=1 FL=1